MKSVYHELSRKLWQKNLVYPGRAGRILLTERRMTTFQAIIYAFIHGFAEFLPISVSAHHKLVPYLLTWPEPSDPLLAALTSGAAMAVLVYFRHDWASMISSMLQVIIFRRKPMTMDERLPFFVILAAVPPALSWKYLRDQILMLYPSSEVLWICGILAGLAIVLWFSDSMSRKNRNMYDWNWLDALLVGASEAICLVPGAGFALGALVASFFRNYSRHAAVKFMIFTSGPLLIGRSIFLLQSVSFGSPMAGSDLNWWSFGVGFIVALFASLLAIGGLMKHIQTKGMAGYAFYRVVVGLGVGAVFWVMNGT